jgi:hypothetical protein
MAQFNMDAVMAAHKAHLAKAQADAKAKADALMKDDTLARSKGNAPEQVEARKRVVKLFCEIHLSDEKPPERDARLAKIDYTQPLFPNNVRGLDVEAPKRAGFMGLGRKPAYIVSAKYPPKTAEDPIYALEYYAVKS